MNIGWRVASIRRTAVRRPCGQLSGAPSGRADQSWARIRSPISPPPASHAASAFINVYLSPGEFAAPPAGVKDGYAQHLNLNSFAIGSVPENARMSQG